MCTGTGVSRSQCMHVCMHADMHVCMRVFMRACLHAYMGVFMRVCMHACVHACVRACMHACIQASATSANRKSSLENPVPPRVSRTRSRSSFVMRSPCHTHQHTPRPNCFQKILQNLTYAFKKLLHHPSDARCRSSFAFRHTPPCHPASQAEGTRDADRRVWRMQGRGFSPYLLSPLPHTHTHMPPLLKPNPSCAISTHTHPGAHTDTHRLHAHSYRCVCVCVSVCV